MNKYQLVIDKRIAHCKETLNTSLDLCNLEIKGIEDIHEIVSCTHLKNLDLSFNKISDIRFLEQLPGLQSLDLGDNSVSEIRVLEQLTNLHSLNLSANPITDYSPVMQLSGLQSLNLSYNPITNFSFLEGLGNLQSLDLSYNPVTDYRFLEKHTGLRNLDLNFNKISDYSFLENLSGLESLSLRSNKKVSDYKFLEQLTSLRKLDLRSNKISDIRFLEQLPGLQSLDLSTNRITDYSLLGKLTGLQSLFLRSNRISDYSFLEQLPNLHSLYLRANLISDYRLLGRLTGLQTLELSANKISDYSFLEKLAGLQSLNLNSNEISDIRFLEQLPGLQSLELSSNKISDISILAQLTNLQILDLSQNIISDIAPLKALKKLTAVNLNTNWIKKLPKWTLERQFVLDYSLFWHSNRMIFFDNPLVSPPIEIVKKGLNDIIQYFDDLEQQGKAHLYEAKLLIVGDGGAGKTSLAWKMKELDCEMPKEGADRTKGIDVQAMPIKNISKPELPFLMNVWDFGGQGYYHSTHQFFLTKRSLYVLLNNTRINKTDFNDWLQTISLFSENSPVILVENEVGGSKSELDLRGLQRFFDNILYVRVADIANTTDGRLERLIQDIQIEIQRLPHVGSELPKQWVKIRERLKEEAKTKTHITDKEFYQICKKRGISQKEEIRRLGGLFHDLGVFLHFREDKVLKRMVILQNAWATKGVYTILDNSLVRAQNGYFTIEQAESIWNNTTYEDLHDELLSLMEKFRLCYRIPYSSPTAYISPNLLSVEQPNFTWDNHQNLIIYYDYEFMPKGILGMLIVELHRYIKDIKNLAWRNGCIFHYQNTDAQVIETYGKKKLEIRVKGAHCVQLASIIISEVDKLNASFKRIKVKKLIPCPCNTCQESSSPMFYDYQDLMRRKAKNKRTIECSISYEDVKVLEILEAAFDENFTEETTLKELIAQGKVRAAIDVFEQEFPTEGSLLLARFNQLERYYYLGMISIDEWSTSKQQIAYSLIALSDNESLERSFQPKKEKVDFLHLDNRLEAIKAQLEGQTVLLNNIIDRSNLHQHELIDLLREIEEKENLISDDFAQEIIAIIEKGMSDFVIKVPQATSIIADWEKASKQLKLAGDAKLKLKWVIPFLFLKFEKEISWNGKDWFKAIIEDIKRGARGNWSEMFLVN